MTRENLQLQAVEFSKKHNNLLLEWATGLGKSKAAILIQEDFKPGTTLLSVAEVAHITNWQDEYKKHNKEHWLDATEIFCHASLKNYKDREVDLLIIDEAHRTSELRIDILSTIKAKRILLLTATMDQDRLDSLSSIFGRFYVSYVPLQEAISKNILPKPKIFIYPVELDNTNPIETIIKERTGGESKLDQKVIKCKLEERWQYLRDKKNYPNIKLIMSCTQQAKYIYMCDEYDYYKKIYLSKKTSYNEGTWLQRGIQRKRFLGETKTNILKLFLPIIKDKRYICFCSTIDQAEQLGNANNTINSKVKESQEIIDRFNNKKINQLFAVNMLTEGKNLTDLDIGIIVQLDGKERSFIQRLGRTLRSEDPVLVIFYVPGTKDEEYLNNALNEVNSEYVYHTEDINDIKQYL